MPRSKPTELCSSAAVVPQKVNLPRREARRRDFITTCDIFGTVQTNILGLCYLFGKNSRVCIFTVPSRVYIRVCKHGKRFLLLNHRWRVKVLREVLLVDHWTVWRKPQKVSPSFVPLSSFEGKFVMVQQAFQTKKSMRTSCILTNDIVTNLIT